MGLLDGKAAIVTGSARGIGRATAELFVSEGAKVLINDLDADVAEQTAGEIDGETAVYCRRPDQDRRRRRARRRRRRRLRRGRHLRQQRRLHLGRCRPPDDRRAVPGDARHPHRRPLPRRPGARPALARGRQGRERRRQGGLPQADQRLLDLGDDGQRRPGQLLGREGGRRRPDQNARQGVGTVQDQRQRGRLRLRRHPPHGRQGGGRRDGIADRREDRARHPRADAGDGLGDHPDRPPRHPRGGLRPGPLPRLRRWPTTSTARRSTSPAACSGGCTPERAPRQKAGPRSATSTWRTGSGLSPVASWACTRTSTVRPGAGSGTPAPASRGCCCSTTSGRRAAPGARPPCSISATARTSSSSPRKAASPSTRPGTTT